MSARARRGLRGLVTAALLVALAAGCADRDMEAGDAREFTGRALRHIGLASVEVDREVQADLFRPSAGDAVDVWRTSATVRGGTVRLYVARGADRAVFLNDVADDGGALLTDEQVEALEDYRLNPATERHRDRVRLPAGVATGLAVLAAGSLAAAVVTGRVSPTRRRPRPRPRRVGAVA